MTDQDLPELPRAIALAWGVAANPTRGPKRELSIERIVDAAIGIADEGGLAAVSMSAVAAQLGVTPMALYRYVSAKDDLVLLMQEQGFGVPPDLEGEGWRPRIENWTRAMAALYVEHPWLLDIPITGIGVTPNSMAWLDAALEALAPVPLAANAKLSVILALMAQGRFEGNVTRGYAQGGDPAETNDRDERLLAALVTPEAYPYVAAAFADGGFGDDPSEPDPFAFGRARVLDGVEALLAGRGAEPADAAPTPAPDALDAAAERDPKVKEAVKARREAEKLLREARKREREQRTAARDRAARH